MYLIYRGFLFAKQIHSSMITLSFRVASYAVPVDIIKHVSTMQSFYIYIKQPRYFRNYQALVYKLKKFSKVTSNIKYYHVLLSKINTITSIAKRNIPI